MGWHNDSRLRLNRTFRADPDCHLHDVAEYAVVLRYGTKCTSAAGSRAQCFIPQTRGGCVMRDDLLFKLFAVALGLGPIAIVAAALLI